MSKIKTIMIREHPRHNTAYVPLFYEAANCLDPILTGEFVSTKGSFTSLLNTSWHQLVPVYHLPCVVLNSKSEGKKAGNFSLAVV